VRATAAKNESRQHQIDRTNGPLPSLYGCERLKATLSMRSSVAGGDVPAPIQAAIRQALSATSGA
jgi:hypothetical protein